MVYNTIAYIFDRGIPNYANLFFFQYFATFWYDEINVFV